MVFRDYDRGRLARGAATTGIRPILREKRRSLPPADSARMRYRLSTRTLPRISAARYDGVYLFYYLRSLSSAPFFYCRLYRSRPCVALSLCALLFYCEQCNLVFAEVSSRFPL